MMCQNLTRSGLLAALVLAACFVAGQASAAPMAWYDATQSAFTNNLGTGGSNWSVGEDFTVGSSPVEITALGFYDYNGHALAAPHDVILWTLSGVGSNTGTNVAQVTVPAGNSAVYEDGTQFVNLAHPIILAPGTVASVVGYGFSGSDPYGCCGPGGLPTSGDLVWVGHDRYDTSGGGSELSPPPYAGGDGNNHAGGNFLFIVTPEPSSYVLCGLGTIGLLFAARRRKA